MRGTRLVTTLTILTALAFFTPAQAERTPGGDSISVFVDAPLANLGFKVIVGYSGHYPKIQIQILREAAEEFTARGGATAIP